LARIPQRAIDPIAPPIHNENVRERTHRRYATIPLAFLLGALVLALATAERAKSALPGEEPTLSVGDLLVPEGTGGTATAVFRVRLSVASSAPVTVGYATSDGGATTPADYAARSGALSFAPGEIEKTVLVPVAADSLDETH
jgi:Calx-beta domain-containing protein